ncbi:MAG: hypothetical protein IJU95_06210 [Treponema sp.]|nr:hypothetical protein [Treponema sp.]
MRDVEKRVGLNGFSAIAILAALYGLSRLFPSAWQIYSSDFSGIIVLLLVALAVSALWLTLYWLLDRLQHEHWTDVVSSFLYSAAAYIALSVAATWVTGSGQPTLLSGVIIPTFTFYMVFSTYIIRKDAFDEIVDSLIYGGFSGTGIAFAICMIDFCGYETTSVRFMLAELITKSSVYAAACSLSGFLLHQLLLRRSRLLESVPVVLLAVLLAIETWAERQLDRNLSWSSLDVMPLAVSFVFVLLVVSLAVFLIHKVLNHEEKKTGGKAMEAVRASKSLMFVCAAIVMLSAFFVRWQGNKTVSFEDGGYRFALPDGFERRVETSGNSLFAFAGQKEDVFYAKSPLKLYLSFGEYELEDISGELSFSPVHGWKIFEQQNQYIDADSRSVRFQYSYKLEKNGKKITVDIYSPLQDVSAARNTVRSFARSLEEK